MATLNQLKRNDKKLEDVKIMEKILCSLISRFEHLIVIIKETKNLKAMTIE